MLSCAAASAQTVIVQNAPPGSTAEFVLNGTVAASATVGPDGLATLAVSGAGDASQPVDVFVWVDECGMTRRVIVMNRTVQPPPAESGCRRMQIAGLFLLQSITSILVDVGVNPATLRLRQGRVPEAWLRPPAQGDSAGTISIAPAGFILFGGAGRGFIDDFSSQACGNVTACDGNDAAISFTGGFSYWFSQYVGAEASYLRLRPMTATGSADRFRFESDMDGGLVAVVGKVGFPIGRVRIFGAGGADYHRATFTTTETIDAATVTVGGTAQTVPGGNHRFQWRTEGWGLAFGGGAEVWVTERFGLYGEFNRFALKGEDVGSGEAETDDTITSMVGGVRFRLAGF